MPPARSESQAAALDPPPVYEERPLPAGWVKEFDPKSQRHFYVDTLATPPRSIWVHPLDDEEFLRTAATAIRSQEQLSEDGDSHDEHATEIAPAASSHPAASDTKKGAFDPVDGDVKRKAAESDGPHPAASSSTPGAGSSTGGKLQKKPKQRGFFGKLKDKAIGTKEEREAARARREAIYREEERLYYERRNAALARRQRELEAMYGPGGMASGHPGAAYRTGGGPWGPPAMNAYGGPQYQQPYQYGQSPYANQGPYGRRQGGGGMGIGLLGGALAGLLVGDLLF